MNFIYYLLIASFCSLIAMEEPHKIIKKASPHYKVCILSYNDKIIFLTNSFSSRDTIGSVFFKTTHGHYNLDTETVRSLRSHYALEE